MADHPFSYYYTLPGGNIKFKYPLPGNGIGKIWQCPTAQATDADLNGPGEFGAGTTGDFGKYGVFSYVMDLDMKLKSAIKHGVAVSGPTGNAYPWPIMPKLTAIRLPTAQVLLAEQAFSPHLETYSGSPVGSGAARNGLYPSQRWSVFTQRHNKGGNIVFIDGHSARFKYDYVFGVDPGGGDIRAEKLNPDIWWNPNRDVNY